MQYPLTGGRKSALPRLKLLALSLSFALMVSGCGSNLPMQQCAQSQVTVDQGLMEKPSYQAELLNFLSDKPSELTTK